MADINNNQASIALVELLGPKIVQNKQGDNAEISVAELAQKKKTIVLYFSAHWCPPCRGFTPKLSEAYAKYKSSKNGQEDGDDGFELVFVSSDQDAEAFKEYHSEMSFPALPYEARDIKAKLSEKFDVQGIPHLVAVDAATGEESPVNAAVGGDLRSFILQHGADAFPLTPSHVEKMKDEAEKKQVDALQKLTASPIMVSGPPYSNNKDEDKNETTLEKTATIKLGMILEQYEYVGLVFGDGDKGDAGYDGIQEAEKALGDNKFIPVYLGWTKYGDSPDHSALWERFHSVRENELTDEVRAILSEVAGESMDDVTMITIKSKGSGLCGLDGKCEPSGVPVIASIDKGLRALRQFGPTAFPWDEAAVKNTLHVKERRVSSLKERLAGFDFLRSQSTDNDSNSLLVRGTSNKEGDNEDQLERKYVSVDDLLVTKEGDDKDDSAVLGLYFSAHWCGPCRAFTPELLNVYKEVQAKKGANSFEVVFISFDNNEEAFEEYYSSMVAPESKEQWLTLDYGKSRELASDLTDVFGVEGFPSLVLMRRDGTIISENARSSTSQFGAGCFPWDAESIKKWEDKLLKEEEENVESQRKQGDGLVVRRFVGPVGSIKYDATDRSIELGDGSFSTALLDETIVSEGVLYYEVEMLDVDTCFPCAQFGFSLHGGIEKMNESTGFGVGDNDKSWGICGFRKELWHDGKSVPIDDPSSTCGWEIGDVIGFAVNVDAGKIAISKNGNWSKEAGCGVVFEKVSLAEADGDGCSIHPSLSCRGLKIRLNVSEKDFGFSKPPEGMWQSSSDAMCENGTSK